jgi:hypothetical protein
MDTADADVVNVDYVSRFSFQMALVTLRHLAALNGLAPPTTADEFSYLELGCGNPARVGRSGSRRPLAYASDSGSRHRRADLRIAVTHKNAVSQGTAFVNQE